MLNKEMTVKCPICNEPYVVYENAVEDQSACPRCRDRARRNMRGIAYYPPWPSYNTNPEKTYIGDIIPDPNIITSVCESVPAPPRPKDDVKHLPPMFMD